MASVWVIEDGEYSDYRVVGVFSSEANARAAFLAMYGHVLDEGRVSWRSAGIAEWPLDPGMEHINARRRQYRIDMLRNGNHVTPPELQVCANLTDGELRVLGRYGEVRGGLLVEQRLVGLVWASDENHAAKIANEKRVQLIATGEWKEPPVVVAYPGGPMPMGAPTVTEAVGPAPTSPTAATWDDANVIQLPESDE